MFSPGNARVHDEINLSYIGLTELEIRVLKSIFTLAPQLKENYSLLPPNRLNEADLVLVNTDDPVSNRRWTKLKAANHLVVSLLLTNGDKLNSSERTIQRPIRVKKLIEALEDIVEQTSIEFENTNTAEELCVLVVDDSYPVRKYMEHKLIELVQMPVDIHFASSGGEAVQKNAKKKYDIIFLDVVMEGMDGYKACKSIKANNNPFVVMLTSRKSPFDKVRGTMSGCNAYVTKPPTDNRLSEVIQKCLAQRPQQTDGLAKSDAS